MKVPLAYAYAQVGPDFGTKQHFGVLIRLYFSTREVLMNCTFLPRVHTPLSNFSSRYKHRRLTVMVSLTLLRIYDLCRAPQPFLLPDRSLHWKTDQKRRVLKISQLKEYFSKNNQLQFIRIPVDRFFKCTLSLDRFLKLVFVPDRFFIGRIET